MKLIIANWKSHKTREEIVQWMDAYEAELEKVTFGVEVAIAPPMPSVMFVSNRLLAKVRYPMMSLAVQDLSPFPAGKYTGAVSTINLQGFNVKYAIVGHSERRRHFHETHQDVANKVMQAVENGITPIVCVDDEYIGDQAAAIDRQYLEKCIVAYEELGAIGTGKNEPVDHVQEVFQRIKTVFGEVKVIYGGSVEADNVQQYVDISDGVLVGTASLDVSHFISLINACKS